jgi:hypothetical protein
VLAEVVTAINRIGGIYKRSLNIGLQLFEDTTALFELDDDAYGNLFDDNGDAILSATEKFESILGTTDGFDVGHIVSTPSFLPQSLPSFLSSLLPSSFFPSRPSFLPRYSILCTHKVDIFSLSHSLTLSHSSTD